MAASTKSNYPNRLRFDLGPQEIGQLADEIITNSKKILDDITTIPANQRTFKNTVRPMDEYDIYFSTLSSSATFPKDVSTSKDVRDAATEANKKLEAFAIEMETREDLYKALREYQTNNSAEIAKLSSEESRLFSKTLQSFERNGLGLEDSKKQRVKEIKLKIADLAIKFQQNQNEDNTKLYFTKEELEGLSDDFINGLSIDKDTSKYCVTLKYPDLFPVMERCKVESTRKQMDFANGTKCIKENTPILEEIIVLRQEEAKLLGFDSHANYILDIRMAKTADTVFKFLHDLTDKLSKPALRDVDRLLQLKKADTTSRGAEFDGKLNIWDWRFYDQMLLEKEYQVDHEFIKQYFPLHKVTQGLLQVYQQVLSLRFQELPKEKSHVWHEDVKQYEVYDKKTDKFVGHFYLDLHPRDGKYGHAAEFALQKGCELGDGTRQFPAAAMVANFTKPTNEKPSLLKFDEVETYFHEFGHVMHELCTQARFSRFAGTNVERDFVEAPSQMLENWCYDAEVLNIISGLYTDTAQALPDKYRELLIKAKYVNEALKNRRQLHFGTFDMEVHTTVGKVDTAALWHKFMKEIALTEPQPGTNGSATFGHIVGGYSAGYYGYLWSKVYSSDMFLRFKKEGVLNETVGRQYRDIILAKGGTEDAMELLKQFLGREPSPDAFLIEIGAKEEL